jgi:hypothetical protein
MGNVPPRPTIVRDTPKGVDGIKKKDDTSTIVRPTVGEKKNPFITRKYGNPAPITRDTTPDNTVVGYFHGDKTRKSLIQKREQSDTK